MRVSQEYADQWTTHLIRTGGLEQNQVVTVREDLETGGDRLRRGKKRKGSGKPRCGNCQLETDFLFDGYKEFEFTPANGARVDEREAAKLRALCTAFQTDRTRVCQRCRPASNLEIQEILRDGR